MEGSDQNYYRSNQEQQDQRATADTLEQPNIFRFGRHFRTPHWAGNEKAPADARASVVTFARGEFVTMDISVPQPDICRQAAFFIIFIAEETGASAALSRSLQASKQD